MKSQSVLLGALSALAVFQIPVPEGFRSFESKTRGLALHVPAKFEELPVSPDEEFIQLKFTEKETSANASKFRPEMWILYIEKLAPVTGAPAEPAKPEDPPELEPKEKSADKDKEPPRPKKITTLEEYFKQRMPRIDSKPDGRMEINKDKSFERWKLVSSNGMIKGVALLQDLGGKDLVLIGLSATESFTDNLKLFEKTAKSLRVTEIRDSLGSEIDAHYRVRPFRNVEYRKKVRRNLPKGWKADDTDNFILIYSTKDERLIAKIKNDLEAVRTKYLELFPPVKEIEAVSTVRVCKDRDEFQKFSGMPRGVAGFWNSATEELVFYDANADPTFHNLGRQDSYIVLYHEAFHQYIYYSCGQVAPHSWFNEGYGDYFSGSVIGRGGKKVDRIESNPWRVATVKKMVEDVSYAPLEKLVRFEQKDYYEKGGFYYAQGWSFVYFLNESKIARKHPVWNKILTVYFDTLKAKYKEELDALTADADQGKVMEAQFKARKFATDQAFQEVNFEELEKAWIDFVSKLKDPTEAK